MKKFLVILTLVLLVSAFAVPAAFAHGYHPPTGNTTSVTVGGSHNVGMVMVVGKGNTTSLNIASNTKWNQAQIMVMGCNNRTSVNLTSGAKGNIVGVAVAGGCR